MHVLDIPLIEEKLCYRFQNRSLVEEAFTHKSYFFEQGTAGYNERLEFLGDAVLQLCVTDYLFHLYPDRPEGELSQDRSRLVDAAALASYAEHVGIAEFLLLGRGERKQERKESLVADLFEAVLGAIYLDGGMGGVRLFLQTRVQEVMEQILQAPRQNSKTYLQEWTQRQGLPLPEYVVIGESGPEHQRVFSVEVRIQGESRGKGEGFSKKEAERKAAEEALQWLQ